jgi:hypothetical protein
MGRLGMARANTSADLSPVIFLLLLKGAEGIGQQVTDEL